MKMAMAMTKIWVPVPTQALNKDNRGGNLKTSPWMYFQPVSSSSAATSAGQLLTSHIKVVAVVSLGTKGMEWLIVHIQDDSALQAGVSPV